MKEGARDLLFLTHNDSVNCLIIAAAVKDLLMLQLPLRRSLLWALRGSWGVGGSDIDMRRGVAFQNILVE